MRSPRRLARLGPAPSVVPAARGRAAGDVREVPPRRGAPAGWRVEINRTDKRGSARAAAPGPFAHPPLAGPAGNCSKAAQLSAVSHRTNFSARPAPLFGANSSPAHQARFHRHCLWQQHRLSPGTDSCSERPVVTPEPHRQLVRADQTPSGCGICSSGSRLIVNVNTSGTGKPKYLAESKDAEQNPPRQLTHT